MTNKVFYVLAALLLSSCSSDWSAGLADKRANSMESAAPAVASSSQMRARAARSFAGAPDRGSLVQYPKDPVVRRSGAYTWHAADLSEDHALRSTITGDLSFTAPDGTPINLAYDRHVEHPDGNWSWIGRAEGERGESTVITFGEDAAFGTIPQGRDQPPLRLTIADGRAWVVSADPRLLREIRNEATHPTDQDFLVPPKLAASTATALGGMEAMGAEAMATTASGKTVVDVLVGFTDGYSTYRGGASAAITRIHNLVEVTNQAYRNSQVNAEVRLVHSMQVSYPDATANKTALEELTGFKAPSTKTTPAPAFTALRSARNQYGADVVVLLRRFQDPENDGCGIAWLIGGGRSGIDASDEFFGYSVVGDGQDAGTDGKTYFCRDETLAHEIGHNMGSQHDADNAKKDDGSVSYGAYSYSFGYRAAASAGDFYTVMAYGDSGQTRNRVFSNPNVSICGTNANIVCGAVDQADNARSLIQTTPLIARFRATIVSLHRRALNDVDGDGTSDIVYQRPGTLAYSAMMGAVIARSKFFPLSSSYNIATMGDYDGDGKLDIVWTSAASDLYVWRGNGEAFSAPISLGTYEAGWTLLTGGGDINGDGKSDLVWQRPGALAVSIMNGAAIVRSSFFGVSSNYRVAATGDYDGDGKLDILWTSASNDLYVWLGTGDTFLAPRYVGVYGAGWSIWPNGGDVDGDGKDDILFHRPGALSYSVMHGATIVRSSFFPLSSDYYIAATGDYDANGKQDILWTSEAKDMYIWFGNGSGYAPPQFVSNYGDGWAIVK